MPLRKKVVENLPYYITTFPLIKYQVTISVFTILCGMCFDLRGSWKNSFLFLRKLFFTFPLPVVFVLYMAIRIGIDHGIGLVALAEVWLVPLAILGCQLSEKIRFKTTRHQRLRYYLLLILLGGIAACGMAFFRSLYLKKKCLVLLLNVIFFLVLEEKLSKEMTVYLLLWFIWINWFCSTITAGCTFILTFGVWWMFGRYPKMTVMLLLIGISAYFLVGSFNFELFYTNPISLMLDRYTSFHERLVVWKRLDHFSQNYFWWGYGPFSSLRLMRQPFLSWDGIMMRVTHPHQLLLELKLMLGIMGYFLAFCAILQLLLRAYRSSNDTRFWLTCGVYALGVFSSFSSLFKDPWILGWIGILSIWRKSSQEETSRIQMRNISS